MKARMVRLSFRRIAALLLALCVPALASGADPATEPAVTPAAVATIVARLPHATNAFTEGLLIDRGKLYESTGYERQSFITRYDLKTGKEERRVQLAPDVFGEGIVVWRDEILNVIWHGGRGQRRSLRDFKLTGSFRYDGEGWAMTQDGHNIILSDGTPVLRFLDPKTMKVVRRLPVTLRGQPVQRINELEYVNGSILANIWLTPVAVRIDPKTGVVTQLIDLSQLVADAYPRDADSVPNGIAYDAEHDRLYITGKNWPWLYEVKLEPASATAP